MAQLFRLPSVSKHTPFNQLHRLLVLSLALLLVACSGERSESLFSTYQQELVALLDEDRHSPATPAIPQMPRASDVRDPIPEFSVGLLTSMRLDRCRVGQVLAQRNSSLGRAQTVTAQLYHEIDMIQALQECLNSSLADNADIRELLNEGLAHKIDTLPAWIDRFLTQSDAMRSALRPDRSMLPREPNNDRDATLAALHYFEGLFASLAENPKAWVDLEPLREHARHLAQSDYLPQLWRTQQKLTGWLQEYNRLLTDGGRKLGCQASSIPAAASDLATLHDDMYTGEVQPLLHRWAEEMSVVREALLDLSEHSQQPRWQDFLQQMTATGPHVHEIPTLTQQHTTLWQQALAQCDLTDSPW